MLNINLFGGPGTGKSTTAALLFGQLKSAGLKTEYITEHAKELSYSKEYVRLSDQLYMLGNQHHRLHRLNGSVDYVIHDSPFIMGLGYLNDEANLPHEEFTALVLKLFEQYDNINIFLERDTATHAYQEYGRNQTLDEAIQKDAEIKALLDNNGINYFTISVNDAVISIILLLCEHGL
jgi:hypothetical protein